MKVFMLKKKILSVALSILLILSMTTSSMAYYYSSYIADGWTIKSQTDFSPTPINSNSAYFNVLHTVKFGKYYIDGTNKMTKQPIEWFILDKTDGVALLISKYVLDSKKFDENRETSTWEDSSLRKWLNDEFYNVAFNDEEKQSILPYVDTGDNVFLLNDKEYGAYFSKNYIKINRRLKSSTMPSYMPFYAMEKGVDYITYEGNQFSYTEPTRYAQYGLDLVSGIWWSRDQSLDGDYEGNIAFNSYTWVEGTDGYKDCIQANMEEGVRPAIWVIYDTNASGILVNEVYNAVKQIKKMDSEVRGAISGDFVPNSNPNFPDTTQAYIPETTQPYVPQVPQTPQIPQATQPYKAPESKSSGSSSFDSGNGWFSNLIGNIFGSLFK